MSRRAQVFIGACVAIGVIGFCAIVLQNDPFKEHVVLYSNSRLTGLQFSPYAWLSTSNVFWVDVSGSPTKYKCLSFAFPNGPQVSLTNLSTRLAAIFLQGYNWSIGGSNWLLAEGVGYTNSTIIQIDLRYGTFHSFHEQEHIIGDYSWVNSLSAWVKVGACSNELCLAVRDTNGVCQISRQPSHLDLKFSFGGGIDDGSYIESSSLPVIDRNLTARRWTLASGSFVEKRCDMKMPATGLVAFYVSPKGDKILWIFDNTHKAPHIRNDFPFVSLIPYEVCELWLSDAPATHFKKLFEFHNDANPNFTWLPDDKRVSFNRRDGFYVASIE